MVTKTDMRWVRSELGTSSLRREVGALRCGLDGTLWRGGEAQDRCVDLVKAHPPQENIDGQVVDILPFDLERAHALYKALLGPVEDMIKGKHLLVVPSGPLTSLPFNVLVTEPPKAQLDERGPARCPASVTLARMKVADLPLLRVGALGWLALLRVARQR